MEPLEDFKVKIKKCLSRLYDTDRDLFSRNHGQGVCERCLVFRLAHYLQNIFTSYYVDCDFNSSFSGCLNEQGNLTVQKHSGKSIRNGDGTETKRFIDIIIHKREDDSNSDFLCFEIKKWNNKKDINKDYNNLKILTTDFGYHYGFHIILGKTQNRTQWTIFRNGAIIADSALMFKDLRKEIIENDIDV